MAISQARSNRKPSGSRYKNCKSKKQFESGNTPVLPKIGEIKSKIVRTLGGNDKRILLKSDTINILNPKTKKAVKAKIKNVVSNDANRNYVRANILTKGTIVETDKGQARVTNRPGQEGTVNGILI